MSCYAGWTRPTVYQAVGCMSSSFWWNSEDFNGQVLPSHAPPAPPTDTVFYLDSGDSPVADDDAHQPGDDYEQTLRVRASMAKLGGYELGLDLHYYHDPDGQHGELWWGRRFAQPILALYGLQQQR